MTIEAGDKGAPEGGERRKGWMFMAAIVLVGIVASAAAAVVPHYSNHYRLDVGVLAVGLLPYLVYGVFAWVAPRGNLLHLVAVLNLVAHLWLLATERFMDFDRYQNGAIYYVPVVFAVLLLALGIMSAHREGKALAPD